MPIRSIADKAIANVGIFYVCITDLVLGVAIMALYGCLVRKLRTMIQTKQGKTDPTSISTIRMLARNKSVMKNSIAVTLVYVICIFPPCVSYMLKEMKQLYYTRIVMVLQCVLDPLVYFFFHCSKKKSPRLERK